MSSIFVGTLVSGLPSTVHWSFDSGTLISGEYQPENDSADNRLVVDGSVPSVTGYIGDAASFSGSPNRLVAAGDGSNYRIEELDTTTHSYTFWFKPLSLSSFQTIICDCAWFDGSGGANQSSGSYVGLDTSGKLMAYHLFGGVETNSDTNGNSTTGYYAIAYSSTTLSVGTWYHVGVTFSDYTTKLYINGNLESAVTSSQQHRRLTLAPGEGRFVIGAEFESSFLYNYHLNALIDDLRGYDTTLADTEVNDIYTGNIGTVQGNAPTGTVHIKADDSISSTNLSSSWEG